MRHYQTGGIRLTTTQIYLTPRQEDVVRRLLAHHAEQAERAAETSGRPLAPGYSREALKVLFGGRVG